MAIRKSLHEFSIGGDHEFTMSHKTNNHLVKLTKYLSQDAPLGRDENSSNAIAEIRSEPSTCPLEVVKSTKQIMENAILENPDLLNFNWFAKSAIQGVVCGSHIHLGHTKKIIPIKEVIEVMDQYIGSISLLLEDRKQGLKRREYNKTPAGNIVEYGRKGNYRTIDHDTLERYEYRTPSTFLSSEEIFKAFMCLSKVVVWEVLNNKSFRFNQYVNEDDFINVNAVKIRKLFPHIWIDISNMNLYRKYKEHLEFIPYLVYKKLNWFPANKIDIKEAWKLNISKINISTGIEENKIQKSIDLDTLVQKSGRQVIVNKVKPIKKKSKFDPKFKHCFWKYNYSDNLEGKWLPAWFND